MRAILPCVLFSIAHSFGQTVTYKPEPAVDPSWELVPHLSDEFNGSAIDEGKWDWRPPWGSYHGHPENTEACLTTDLNNRKVEGGRLLLSATNTTSTCSKWDGTLYTKPYTVGGLFSDSTIKYGYFEIKMRIPDNTGSPPVTDGFGPNFWMWPLQPYPKDEIGDVLWSEIDVYEFRAKDNLFTCNMHYKELLGLSGSTEDTLQWNIRGDESWHPEVEGSSSPDDTIEFGGGTWHTFSCVWGPNRVSFFRDGIHVRSTDKYCSKLIPMNLVVDINTPAVNFKQTTIPSTSTFPYTYEIDYIRVYKLGMTCDEVVEDCSFWFGGYDNKVKKRIVIGNGGCGNVQPSGTNLFLRATDEVEIHGTFEVPLGAELVIETGDICYE